MSETAVSKATEETAGYASARLAPFLVWPVARREVYIAVCVSLLPTLAWGAVIFGWRALAGALAMTLGAIGLHLLLRRTTYRGKRLLVAHTAGSALLVACLSHPIWPAWVMLLAGVALPALIFLWGGPGRERIASALVVAIALLIVAPSVLHHRATDPGEPGFGDRILTRDHLFSGNLHDSPPDIAYARWPRANEIGYYDAVPMYQPAQVANGLLDLLSASVGDRSLPMGEVTWKERVERFRAPLEESLVMKLPALERVIAGTSPGLIGCVSAVAIGLGGLYLAYRNILRPKSCFVFIAAFGAGLLAMALTPDAWRQIGLSGVVQTWQASSGVMITLLAYSFFGSDALFAAVFLLAWPGTEPITPRGRLLFLIFAGLVAAALHRFSPVPLPAASLTLTIMQPTTALFDRFFRHRSWLNR